MNTQSEISDLVEVRVERRLRKAGQDQVPQNSHVADHSHICKCPFLRQQELVCAGALCVKIVISFPAIGPFLLQPRRRSERTCANPGPPLSRHRRQCLNPPHPLGSSTRRGLGRGTRGPRNHPGTERLQAGANPGSTEGGGSPSRPPPQRYF